jgi:hypothetical protein
MKRIIRCTECERLEREMSTLKTKHEKEIAEMEKKLSMMLRELSRVMKERDEYRNRSKE